MIGRNDMIDMECAEMGVKCYAPTEIKQAAYHYDLNVPHLLSRDQMELILRMISQMKREHGTMEPVRLLWRKEEPWATSNSPTP